MGRNASLDLDGQVLPPTLSKRFFSAAAVLNIRLNSSDSAKRAATRALAATCRNIEKTVAPPTLEQARVMGVESVVEGVEWNLSTDQLQVRYVCITRQCHG